MAWGGLGEALRAARIAAHLTQTDAADALGIDQSRLSSWERGTSVPHHYRLAGIAELYGLDEDELDTLWERAKLEQLRGPEGSAVTRREIAEIQARTDEVTQRIAASVEALEARVDALERRARRH